MPLRRQAEVPSFLQGKVWYRVAPSSAPVCALGHLPPEGKALGGGKDPSRLQNHPLPARPAGGRAVTGVRYRAAGQAEKREPPQGPPNQSRESRGEKLSPLALFPPFLGRNGGPRRVGALRGAAPRGLGKAPPTRRVRSTAIPPRQARAPPNGPLFFCAILCNFFAPTVYAGVQLWPRFPRG